MDCYVVMHRGAVGAEYCEMLSTARTTNFVMKWVEAIEQPHG